MIIQGHNVPDDALYRAFNSLPDRFRFVHMEIAMRKAGIDDKAMMYGAPSQFLQNLKRNNVVKFDRTARQWAKMNL